MSTSDDVEDENDMVDEVGDPRTGEIRLCTHRCSTCVFRPGNLMDLRPGRLSAMVREAQRNEGHIVCHKTLGTGAAAICRGFVDANQGTSLALRFGRALGTLREVTPPETSLLSAPHSVRERP